MGEIGDFIIFFFIEFILVCEEGIWNIYFKFWRWIIVVYLEDNYLVKVGYLVFSFDLIIDEILLIGMFVNIECWNFVWYKFVFWGCFKVCDFVD